LKPEKPLVLLTNSSLLYLDEVIKDILNFDIIDAKIDAISEESFKKVNRPTNGITIDKNLFGIRKLKENFKGKLHIQIMVTQININEIEKIANFVDEIKPDEVHLNTPTRYPWKKPIPKEILIPLKKFFKNLKVRTPYD
jgi:wyosine [tRNA(Phe)-imidazoG37] synthetase (radical SAM superfamily)